MGREEEEEEDEEEVEERELELIEDNLDGFPKDTLEELKDKKSNATLLSKFTLLEGSKRCFDFKNSDLQKLTESEFQEIKSNWNQFLESIGDFVIEKGYSFFEILDIARRLNSGLGSFECS